MNSIVIATLIATVSAQKGTTCVAPAADWSSVSVTGSPTDAEECMDACKVLAGTNTNDYCCYVRINSDEAADYLCEAFEVLTSAKADDIRQTRPDNGDWSW